MKLIVRLILGFGIIEILTVISELLLILISDKIASTYLWRVAPALSTQKIPPIFANIGQKSQTGKSAAFGKCSGFHEIKYFRHFRFS